MFQSMDILEDRDWRTYTLRSISEDTFSCFKQKRLQKPDCKAELLLPNYLALVATTFLLLLNYLASVATPFLWLGNYERIILPQNYWMDKDILEYWNFNVKKKLIKQIRNKTQYTKLLMIDEIRCISQSNNKKRKFVVILARRINFSDVKILSDTNLCSWYCSLGFV